MDILLMKRKWLFVLLCLNDIVIFLRTLDDHIHHVGQMLTLSHDAIVTFNFEEMQMFYELN